MQETLTANCKCPCTFSYTLKFSQDQKAYMSYEHNKWCLPDFFNLHLNKQPHLILSMNSLTADSSELLLDFTVLHKYWCAIVHISCLTEQNHAVNNRISTLRLETTISLEYYLRYGLSQIFSQTKLTFCNAKTQRIVNVSIFKPVVPNGRSIES